MTLQLDVDRDTADEFRDEAEFHQILGLHLFQELIIAVSILLHDLRSKTDGAGGDPLFDDLFQSVEGPSADKEDILCIDLDQLLLRMLPATLGRNGGDGSLQNL